MRDPENIRAVASLPIDLMGFIFYEKSPRYIRNTGILPAPAHVQRVGVFVNAAFDFIVEKIKTHQLSYLQLHGDESPEYCRDIQREIEATRTPTLKGEQPTFSPNSDEIQLIKAFRVNEDFDFSETKKYEKYCAYFLFDTKKKKTTSQREEEYGGTGKKFNWQILQQYTGDTPFLLSGGIGAEDVEAVQNFSHPQFEGIDLNSKFEREPALKNVQKIEDFLSVVVS